MHGALSHFFDDGVNEIIELRARRIFPMASHLSTVGVRPFMNVPSGQIEIAQTGR